MKSVGGGSWLSVLMLLQIQQGLALGSLYKYFLQRISKNLTDGQTQIFLLTFEAVNADETIRTIVYSKGSPKDAVHYCRDDRRHTFLAIRQSDNGVTVTGFFVSDTNSILEVVCMQDLCNITETSVPKSTVDGHFIDRVEDASSRRRRSIRYPPHMSIAEQGGSSHRDFYVPVLVMIDSTTVEEHCKRQWPTCCHQEINTENLCDQVRDYYMNVMSANQQLFLDIDHDGMTIDVSVVDILVISKDGNNSYFDQFVQLKNGVPTLPISKAAQYAISLTKSVSSSYNNIAASVTFVAHDLAGKSGQRTIGGAFPHSVCGRTAVAVIEERFGYSSFFTLIHELGHIFGSEHDGLFIDCGSTVDMLMGKTFNKNNPEFSFVFSCCSLAQMYYIMKRESCLQRRPANSSILSLAAYKSMQLGQLLTIDDYCRLTEGAHFKACARSQFDTEGIGFCKGVFCSNTKIKDDCAIKKGLPALNGVACGFDGRWCQYGDCVPRTKLYNFKNSLQRNCNITYKPRQKVVTTPGVQLSWSQLYGGWIKVIIILSSFLIFILGSVFYTKVKLENARKRQRSIYPMSSISQPRSGRARSSAFGDAAYFTYNEANRSLSR